MADTCPTCKGALWLCVDHREPWPHEGCDAEGMACVCNPNGAVAWGEIYADNSERDDGPPQ